MEVDIIGHFYSEIQLSSDYIKFASIAVLFLITILFNLKKLNKRDFRLLQLGLFFTVLADFHLIILEQYSMGIVLFSLVQIIYIARYDIENFNQNILILLITLMSIILFYLLSIYFNIKIDFLILIAIFYAICICVSLYNSIKGIKEDKYPYPNKNFIVLGMILFLLCDINVALSYKGIFYSISSKLIWIFYLPSQILLSISGYEFDTLLTKLKL